MAEWVRLCDVADAPAEGQVAEWTVGNTTLCLSRIEGVLGAVDNWCPHRQGPLGQGWVENGQILCPWHGWAFDPKSGVCTNATGHVKPFAVKVEGDAVLVEME